MEHSHYEIYQKLKGWDEAPFMTPTIGDEMFFNHYLGSCAISGSRILEIGFGNGNFLGWAKGRGADLYGTEIQETAILKAKNHGVNVLNNDILDIQINFQNYFSLMAAIDVMEHLTMSQNEELLVAASSILTPGGLLLIRFPNGQSPLSLPLQYGDCTHVSVMSIPIVSQMILALPLVIDYAGPPMRTLTGGIASRLARVIQSALRRICNTLIRLVYGDVPMYENAVMVLRRL